MTEHTETTVQISPDTDLRDVIRPGDRVRIEFEVDVVDDEAFTTTSGDWFAARGKCFIDNPITVIRPAEPTVVEQIGALPKGERFIAHWEDGTQAVFLRTGEAFPLTQSMVREATFNLLAATRIEVLTREEKKP